MILSKRLIVKQVEEMPEDFTLDELFEKLILIEKVNIGLENIADGKVISDEDMENNINEWFG